MTIRCILIDDEPRGISMLQKMLELLCPDVEVLATCLNPDEAIEKIFSLKPDLVFLDISMPGKNAFEMLEEIGEIFFEIIFVTAYNDFTEQALHLSAVDYLLKPVREELLVEAVKRAAQRIQYKSGSKPVETLLYNSQYTVPSQKMKLCIPSTKGFEVIEIQNIIYIEADSNYSNFHLLNKHLICASKPIHEYASLLEDCNFIRIHKSFVINLDHVTNYVRGEGGSIVLTGGKEVEVSRRKKELLMQRMKEYFRF
jgi:two-component system, LytTR family, response regulator